MFYSIAHEVFTQGPVGRNIHSPAAALHVCTCREEPIFSSLKMSTELEALDPCPLLEENLAQM